MRCIICGGDTGEYKAACESCLRVCLLGIREHVEERDRRNIAIARAAGFHPRKSVEWIIIDDIGQPPLNRDE